MRRRCGNVVVECLFRTLVELWAEELRVRVRRHKLGIAAKDSREKGIKALLGRKDAPATEAFLSPEQDIKVREIHCWWLAFLV